MKWSEKWREKWREECVYIYDGYEKWKWLAEELEEEKCDDDYNDVLESDILTIYGKTLMKSCEKVAMKWCYSVLIYKWKSIQISDLWKLIFYVFGREVEAMQCRGAGAWRLYVLWLPLHVNMCCSAWRNLECLPWRLEAAVPVGGTATYT